MDYCHPCQRHLNGALACAGCGTPADALSPYAVLDLSGGEPERAAEILEPSGPTAGRRRAAARRGRRAHRRRGRTLLLTGAGVVLALGALSLAELAMEPEGDSGAADYVSGATSSATEAAPSASTGARPEGPGPVEAPTVVPVTDSHSAVATDGPARTTAPGETSRAPAPGDVTSSAPAPQDPGATGSAPPGPSASGSGEPTAEPTRPEPSETPEPTPSPSETCEKWLWFCV